MTKNKFVLFFISTMIFGQLGIEHRMFQFGSTGLGNFSDMNGYGHYLPTFSWFNVYWFGFAGILFAIALLFSTRGAETQIVFSLARRTHRQSMPLRRRRIRRAPAERREIISREREHKGG